MPSEPKISSSEKKNSSLKRIRASLTKKWRDIGWVKIFTIIAFIILFFLVIILFITIYFTDATSNEESLPGLLGNLAVINDKDYDIGVAIERLGFAIGGIIALLVALASFQRAKALDDTAKALDDTAKAQEQGNIEDRYKNAITQFGNETPSVRLAGAYGLYHLAIDNEDRRKNICDVLCVHIRGITTGEATVDKTIAGKEIIYSKKYEAQPSNEVQSILDLLTNKDNEEDFPFESKWINLANAYLNGANLKEAVLQGANLKEARLQKANLFEAQLQEAFLWGAQLQEAFLWKTQLQRAYLFVAQLQGAELFEAQLQGAKLLGAQLQDANLNGADLQNTILDHEAFESLLKAKSLMGTDVIGMKFIPNKSKYASISIKDLVPLTEEQKNELKKKFPGVIL